MATVNSSAPHTTHLTTIQHDNGIYELIFNDTSIAAVNEWAAYQAWLNTNALESAVIRQLLDLRIGLPPGVYTIQQTRQLMARFPAMPHHRVAIIYPRRQNSTLQIFGSMLNMLRFAKLRVRYFVETDYDKALLWLLADD